MGEQRQQVMYGVVTPAGRILTSTLSVRPHTAAKLCLDIAEQRYNGLVSQNFEKWKARGYRVERLILTRTFKEAIRP